MTFLGEAPGLSRTASERARDMTLAKLMGSGPAEPSSDPMTPSFRTAGPPPTLGELQQRHAASRQDDAALSMAAQGDAATPERQEARTNLIRKLSRGRDADPSRTATCLAANKQAVLPLPAHAQMQPFESGISACSIPSMVSSIALTRACTLQDGLDRSPPVAEHQWNCRRAANLPQTSATSSCFADAQLAVISRRRTDIAENEIHVESPHSRESHAQSVFRPYRHTMERDRDSALARLTAEDVWEFDKSVGPEGDPARSPCCDELNTGLIQTPISEDPSASQPHYKATREEKISAQDSPPVHSLTFQSSLPYDGEDLYIDVPAVTSFPRERPFPHPEPHYRFPVPPPPRRSQHANLVTPEEPLLSTPRASSPALMRSSRSANDASPLCSPESIGTDPQVPAMSPQYRRPRSSSLSPSPSAQHANVRLDAQAEGPPPIDSSPSECLRDNLHAFVSGQLPGKPAKDAAELGQIDRQGSKWPQDWSDANTSMNKRSKTHILSKLNSILLEAESKPFIGSPFGDPPRYLILHAPVLQVVNANTVKDRYLLLFNDVLVIAKPILDECPRHGELHVPSLDSRFLVKSVVEVGHLKLTTQRDEDDDRQATHEARSAQLLAFIHRFADNPHRAVQSLVDRGSVSSDPAVLASLLFRTPRLDRTQLGVFLSDRECRYILRAFVERFKMHGIQIEDALRSFLSSLRLPPDLSTAEHLVSTFAGVWLAQNPGVSGDPAFARKLVTATLELNDYLNSGRVDEGVSLGAVFGFPNSAVSVEDFIAAFRLRDASRQCSDEVLTRIYRSIQDEPLRQGQASDPLSIDWPVIFSPTRFPHRLTYKVATQSFSVTLPVADPHFRLRLVGQDLLPEPATLSFETSSTQTFRLTGLALGSKTLHFIKYGPHAMRYTGIPLNRSFSVERAFMKHTFQLAFVNHLNVKRKYMFSMMQASARNTWVSEMQRSIAVWSGFAQDSTDRVESASRAVSLQILRDAVISPEEVVIAPNGTPVLATRSKPSTPRPSSGNTQATSASRAGHVRSNSFSRLYAAGAGRDEAALRSSPAPIESPTLSRLVRPRIGPSSPSDRAIPQHRRGSRDEVSEMVTKHSYVGHELVLLARQNSLLPSVLSLMNSLQDVL